MVSPRAAAAILLVLAATPASSAERPRSPRGDVLLMAWSSSGDLALIQESVRRADGSPGSIAFRVVGPGVVQKRFVVSDELRDGSGGARAQKVSAAQCRAALVELRDLLRAKRFQGATLDGKSCEADRSGAVTIAPHQAAAADDSEAEPLPSGDGLEIGDWRIRIERDSLTVFGPGQQMKTLRLPRPIAPEAAHVRLSPTRRLLLVLQSVEGGDQILIAGFSSKTGALADFE